MSKGDLAHDRECRECGSTNLEREHFEDEPDAIYYRCQDCNQLDDAPNQSAYWKATIIFPTCEWSEKGDVADRDDAVEVAKDVLEYEYDYAELVGDIEHVETVSGWPPEELPDVEGVDV